MSHTMTGVYQNVKLLTVHFTSQYKQFCNWRCIVMRLQILIMWNVFC